MAQDVRLPLVAGLALLLLAPPASAVEDADARYGADYQRCSGDSTLAIVECVGRRTDVWDCRLNASYRKLMGRIEGEQGTRLRDAQRRWIEYRDANCGFYAAGQGTISRIETAECLRSMTAARAAELSDAADLEKPVGSTPKEWAACRDH